MTSSGQLASVTDGSASSTFARALLPQTTPFIPPTGCGRGGTFLTTTGAPGHSGTFIVSDPSQFPTCQPAGWDSGATRFHYSPAVCPSGWTAYYLSVSSISDAGKFESQAACCSESFTYTDYYYNPFCRSAVPACFSQAQTEKLGEGVVTMHDPWQIRWQETDVTSLSPTPPSMVSTCNNVQVTSWVPGSKAKVQAACGYPPAEIEHGVPYFGPAAFWIWLPILIVLLICFGLCFGCYRRRKWKREEQTQREAERAAKGTARETEVVGISQV